VYVVTEVNFAGRLFELFTSLKDRTLLAKDSQAHNIIDDAINLVSLGLVSVFLHVKSARASTALGAFNCHCRLRDTDNYGRRYSGAKQCWRI
jgi:hypothetical protein